jgi:hypothetical protein
MVEWPSKRFHTGRFDDNERPETQQNGRGYPAANEGIVDLPPGDEHGDNYDDKPLYAHNSCELGRLSNITRGGRQAQRQTKWQAVD